MASAAAPISTNGGTGASMWASQPGPPRSGWTGKSSETGPGLRGKGSSRGRGGRGGGRGRATNGKNGPSSKSEPALSRGAASADQPQEKPSSDPPKRPSQPSPMPPPSQTQSSAPSRQSNRPRPARKGSESKGARKGPTLTVDPSATSTSNTSSSPSVSPHTPSRRKRGGSKVSAPIPVPAVPVVPRKQSVSQEDSAPKETTKETKEPKEKLAPAKDIPPHLAPPPPPPPSAHFDIKHDIDALVERVRAVAMDRPHTPGSHIDWAGDEDDSLPDLDDWGVPSTTTTLSSQPLVPPKGTADIISPILQDTLKPLPMIDIDIPTPSIRLHEVNEDAVDGADGGDETPRETVPSTGISLGPTNANTGNGPSSTTSRPNGAFTPAATPSPAKNSSNVPSALSKDAPEGPSINGKTTSSAHPGDAADLSPHGLSASIHASASMPNGFSSRPPRASFQPAHGRSQTVGRFKPEHRPGSERPQREISHGRNHSTPPTAPASARGRAAHATRPVISGDAISRLARTLGGSAAPRKPKDIAAAAAEAA